MRKGKERSRLSRDWETVRAEIEAIISDKNLDASSFRRLRNNEGWAEIEEKIYHQFCTLDHPLARPVWLWENFKQETFAVEGADTWQRLEKLVDHDELVWFFTNGDKDKLWFYEGKVKAVITIIEESSYLDEFYICSKKYEWMICFNHHDTLIATGSIMPGKLRSLQE